MDWLADSEKIRQQKFIIKTSGSDEYTCKGDFGEGEV